MLPASSRLARDQKNRNGLMWCVPKGRIKGKASVVRVSTSQLQFKLKDDAPCVKELHDQYRLKDKEALKYRHGQLRLYRLQNKDAIKIQQRQYRLYNRQKFLE